MGLAVASPSSAQTPSAKAGADRVELLRPGDVVRLRIWREPELSGEFKVDESGYAILPRLGPVDVGRLSSDSLKRFLIASYRTYLRNPAIEVTLLRHVNVLGSVRNPGAYAVDPTMQVADALALAGGPTPDGKSDQVELLRHGERLMIKISSATRLADTPIQSGDQLFVPQRSWLSRNAGLVVGTLTATAGVIVTLVQ